MPALLDSWIEANDGFAPVFCEPILRLAFDHLERGLGPGAVVVDVGCGSGHVTAVLRRSGYRAAGFDRHLDTVRAGRASYPGEQVFVADVRAVPLADASADALFCFSVLQYMDRERALEECSRVLKPGGRFAIVENLRGNPLARLERRRMRRSGRAFADHLRPLDHLRWSRRAVYEHWFSQVRYEPFYLLTPAFLLSRCIRAGHAGRGSAARRTFRMANAVERALIRAIPPLRSACWNVLAYGAR